MMQQEEKTESEGAESGEAETKVKHESKSRP